MAHWQRTLDLTPWWNNTTCNSDNGTIEPPELCKHIAEALKAIPPFNYPYSFINDMKDELIYSFEAMAKSDDLDWDEVNYEMARLYDWGDTPLDQHFGGKKVCWIKTNF